MKNYDSTGTLSNLYFEILVYWAHEFSKAQIGEKFGFKDKWACKHIGSIYKILGVCTRHGAIDKAWQRGIFTAENRSPEFYSNLCQLRKAALKKKFEEWGR